MCTSHVDCLSCSALRSTRPFCVCSVLFPGKALSSYLIYTIYSLSLVKLATLQYYSRSKPLCGRIDDLESTDKQLKITSNWTWELRWADVVFQMWKEYNTCLTLQPLNYLGRWLLGFEVTLVISWGCKLLHSSGEVCVNCTMQGWQKLMQFCNVRLTMSMNFLPVMFPVLFWLHYGKQAVLLNTPETVMTPNCFPKLFICDGFVQA